MKIAVAGTGYVGLVTGVCLAQIGHIVTCVDIDPVKIELLISGKCPIFEQGLEELLMKNRDRLEFTTNYQKAYKEADVIFIGVGTPERHDGSANLAFTFSVAKQIAESVERDSLVVVKSTVPIGSCDRIEQVIKKNLLSNLHVEVASNPEFLSQGTAIWDTMHANRIVLGIKSKWAEYTLRKLFDGFNAPYVITDRRSAEMIKYASNDFLALKISYINEIANLCELVGANIDDVSKGMGMDTRIGDKFLKPGVGYGGSCFPKDTKALHWLANMHDREIKTIKAAIEVNENQKVTLIKKSRKYFESFAGLTVAVLGLTFKPDTDDLREAPSLKNIPILLEEGAKIKVWDPVGMDNYRMHYPTEIEYCQSIIEALTNADLCMIFTEWNQIKEINPRIFKQFMRRPVVLDGRNCFELADFKGTGIIYESIGRRTNFHPEGEEVACEKAFDSYHERISL